MFSDLTSSIISSIRNLFRSFSTTPGFSNTLWLFADRLIRMVVGLVVGVWVARYLGPAGYGQLSFAGSYLMLFSAVALFGLESLVIRELVSHQSERGAILGTTFMIRLAAGFCAYLSALTIMMISRPDDRLMLVMVALLGSSLLSQALDVTDLWFQAQVASRFSVVSRSAAFLISSLAKVAMVLAGASLVAITVATALEAVIAAFALVLAYHVSGEQIKTWRWSSIWFRKLWSDSVPMVLSGIVLMVYLRIDQVMLGALSTQIEVGQYAAAVRISELWYFVPAAIVSSVFPRLVQLKSTDSAMFHVKLQRLYNLLAFLGYAVAVPVTFMAPWLINLLFGKAYQPAAPLLAVLIWAGLFANISVVRNAHFIAMEWGKAMLWSTTAGAVVNVMLNLLLIPRFGGMGAAVSTCFSYWVAAHGACYVSVSLRPSAAMILRALVMPRWW